MILIADSGSTKTTWSFVNDNSTKTFSTEGINPFYQNENEIHEMLKKTFSQKKYQDIDINILIFYGAGCTNENMFIIENALSKTFPQAKSIEVYSDMLGAARSVCGDEEGIVSILGTGSNSCLYNGKEIIEQQFSLGFWLGDEGSGGQLGKTFLQYYLRDELPSGTLSSFMEEFKISKPDILFATYNKAYPNRFFASFVPFLFKNLSDPFVENLVKNSFEDFFDKYLKKYTDNEHKKVHFIGSVAYYFKNLIYSIALEKEMLIGQIIQSPSEGLILYHSSPMLPVH